MKTNKKEILEAAAYLFMTKGYLGTTISQISKAVGLQKASLFSHIKSKEELYRKVVETYILKRHDPGFKFQKDISCNSLSEFIDRYIDGISKSMEELYGLNQSDGATPVSNYFCFILEACQKYSDCKSAFLAINQKEIDLWEVVIKKAQKNGEVRADIDANWAAKMFRYDFSGMSYIFSIDGGVTIDQLRDLLYSSYKVIKA